MRVVFHAPGDDKTVAGFDLERRLAFHEYFALAFEDVADLIARMRVPARGAAGDDLDARDYGFAAGYRDVFARHHRARNRRRLCDERAGGYQEEERGAFVDGCHFRQSYQNTRDKIATGTNWETELPGGFIGQG